MGECVPVTQSIEITYVVGVMLRIVHRLPTFVFEADSNVRHPRWKNPDGLSPHARSCFVQLFRSSVLTRCQVDPGRLDNCFVLCSLTR